MLLRNPKQLGGSRPHLEPKAPAQNSALKGFTSARKPRGRSETPALEQAPRNFETSESLTSLWLLILPSSYTEFLLYQ